MAEALKKLKCPRCFSKRIRRGVGLPGPNDDEMELRSMDGELKQCRDCGYNEFEECFFDNSAMGTMSVSFISEREL